MGVIAIRLDPRKLENPDTDMRYDIPNKIQLHSGGTITDDGYDYLDEGDYIMVIYLSSKNPESDVDIVVDILSRNTFSGNSVLDVAQIGIKSSDKYELKYPSGSSMEVNF
ncbi:hypothetical protein ACJJIF_11985 [Microbulbifer sp. SSSA002]|uniref:hypothetical protein n=1 Tax=Microbulbifer sp. SSSA002 TaxID=3243376 RepID=UPI00403A7815